MPSQYIEAPRVNDPYGIDVFGDIARRVLYEEWNFFCNVVEEDQSAWVAPNSAPYRHSLNEVSPFAYEGQPSGYLPQQLTEVKEGEHHVRDPFDGTLAQNIFIGQLPFDISISRVNYLIRKCGGASHVYHLATQKEKTNKRGNKELRPTGCVYAEIPAHEADMVIANLHRRLLMCKDKFFVGASEATLKTMPGSRFVVCERAKCEGPSMKRYCSQINHPNNFHGYERRTVS